MAMSGYARWVGRGLAVTAAGLMLGLPGGVVSAQEIQGDLQELRQDNREIREDRRELRADTREVHRDRRALRRDVAFRRGQ